MKWTAEAERDLLLLIVQMYVTKIDYQEVAHQMGSGVSVTAVQKHISRIRRRAGVKGITTARGVKQDDVDIKDEEDQAIKLEVM